LKRENNEDSLFLDNALGLYLVADGMGGAASGEVASRLVAETVAGYVKRYVELPLENPTRFDSFNGSLSPRANTLMQGIHQANSLVFTKAKQETRHKGMGSTLAVLMEDEDKILVANVGDSRVFRSRKGQLDQLTVDHRLADDPKFKGMINPEATIMSTMGNTLTRAMGVRERVHPDLHQMSYQEGDVYLLCSDGLSDMVPVEMVAKILPMSSSPDVKAKDLIELALAGGGRDNVTVIVVQVFQEKGLKKLFNRLTSSS